MLASARRVPLALRLRLFASTASTSHRPIILSSFSSKQASATSQWTPRDALSRSFSTSLQFRFPPGAAPAEKEDEDASSSAPPLSTFSELSEKGLVHKTIIDTITKKMKFNEMTQVQSLTIAEGLTGVDVLAQAKTGTGKTMAFLLPIIQRLLQKTPALAERDYQRRAKATDIRGLIISPTRELAEQIMQEAVKLTSNTSLVVQLAVGGTQKRSQLSQMHRQGCHLLIGTPGRLKDVFSDPSAGVEAPKLEALVLDEADRLLDDGFWPEVQAIQSLLPDVNEQDRQTLMFSATVPRDVVLFARSIMKRNLHYVQTVSEDDVPTHQLVRQKLVVLPSLEYSLPAILELCAREIKRTGDPSNLNSNFKAIIYFNTTAEVELAAEMFHNISVGRIDSQDRDLARSIGLHTLSTLPIHSKLTQQQRTRAAEAFRKSDSAILLSSDVTARGMDFPNVTHVIQVGLSKDGRDSYIHRIGRTARAGKSGEGWLFVPAETVPAVRKAVRDMPLERDTSLETLNVTFNESPTGEVDLSGPDKQYFKILQDAARYCNIGTMRSAYTSFLGANSGYWRDRQELVEQLNRVCQIQWSLPEPPTIDPQRAQNMGLGISSGLNVREGGGNFRGMGRERGQGSRNQSYGGRRNAFDDYGRDSRRDNRRPPNRNSMYDFSDDDNKPPRGRSFDNFGSGSSRGPPRNRQQRGRY